MKVFKYNKDSLLFERSNIVLKYRVILSVLFICFGAILTSFVSVSAEKKQLENKIKEKDYRLSLVKAPLREDTYVKDVIEAIGYNFSQKEEKKIEIFIKKHKHKIEEAKVPITMVVWLAYKESNFNCKASNPNSSAKGLFQFIDSSWNSMCKLKGLDKGGRFDENKQIDIALAYFNYMYNKEGNWQEVLRNYHGNKYHYPTQFLFK